MTMQHQDQDPPTEFFWNVWKTDIHQNVHLEANSAKAAGEATAFGYYTDALALTQSHTEAPDHSNGYTGISYAALKYHRRRHRFVPQLST